MSHVALDPVVKPRGDRVWGNP
ncbi:palindromic element RPE4 domain-containing protein [Pyruvatibacter mobilis]|uniref:Palindromic element RPE4 domain-containing protein n=1 Tax=Pyruvatibacter mobilis TaxID=1712261 RepID=A0A845Q7Y4_9HYPH|nr:palindromic element RPE4 domain-containing protein [Pyruvatibacter mobilis]QJD76880.1 palindromic element RPE4 domain-containing protein [Pyruvatibacter mobilis]